MTHQPCTSLRNITKRSLRLLTPLALVVALSGALLGCAQVTTVKPGTPVKEVTSKFGKPAVSCKLKDGSQRVVYTSQPSGEQAWAASVSSNGTVGASEQVLTDSHFKALSSGQWSADRVRCEFGPAAEVESHDSSNDEKTVWTYHYLQDQSPYVIDINFDPKTNIVVNYNEMPDPERNSSMIGGH